MRLIDEAVLLDLINNWQDICEYYSDKKPNNISIKELKQIIKDCPTAGEDAAYVKSKRLADEYIKGEKHILKEVEILIKRLTRDENN